MTRTTKIDHLSISRYRAFDRLARIDLAPITLVIGGNHAGKSTLVRAPWFLSQPLAHNATSPFPYLDASGTVAPSLERIARGPSGLDAELGFTQDGTSWTMSLLANGATDSGARPLLGRFHLIRDGQVVFDQVDIEWSEVAQVIRQHGLEGVHDSIGLLDGLRAEGKPTYTLQGFIPENIGFRGENAPQVLAAIRDHELLNTWAWEHLGVRYGVERDGKWQLFSITVADGSTKVLLPESGTGVIQVLPVAVALLVLPQLPSLYCIEHPELHLHPHAHRAVAELLILGRQRHPGTSFLVETHSDTLLLRLRRAIVEGRLQAADLRILHVKRGAEGSTVETIELNDRGVPNWWPKGVFGEAQEEYKAMRSELNKRDQQDRQ